jgi:hypothetical protein
VENRSLSVIASANQTRIYAAEYLNRFEFVKFAVEYPRREFHMIERKQLTLSHIRVSYSALPA